MSSQLSLPDAQVAQRGAGPSAVLPRPALAGSVSEGSWSCGHQGPCTALPLPPALVALRLSHLLGGWG